MLKVKDNKIQKRYKGYWVKDGVNHLDSTDIVLNNNCDKGDITYIIDKILKNEGYDIEFENCIYFGQDEVITYEFDDNLSIQLFEIEKDKNYNFYICIETLENSNDIYKILYIATLFKNVLDNIKSDNLIEKENE